MRCPFPMEKTKDSSRFGDTYALSRSIISVVQRGVNSFCPSLETASVGPGSLECGNRAIGSSRDRANQCSTRVGAKPTGTSGLSTLTRVVSGCEAQKRKKAARAGCDLLFRALVAVDRTSVGNREPADGTPAGCHDTAGTLDAFITHHR